MKKERITITIYLIIAMLLLITYTFPTKAFSGEPDKKSGHFIVLIVDQITLEDLNNPDLKNFNHIVNNGAIALMNTSTGGETVPDNTYLTIGSSSRATGYKAASQGFNINEEVNGQPVLNIFWRRNGFSRVESGNVINLCVEQLKNNNKDRHYNIIIGSLGNELHKAGLKTAVIGNADMFPEDVNYPFYIYGRQVVTLLMDSRGVVDYGDVSSALLVKDKNAPFGIRTNEKELLNTFINNYYRSQVIAIDFGETTRAAQYAQSLNENNSEVIMKTALKQADNFLGRLLNNIDPERDCLMVVAPTPSPKNKSQGNTLTPVILIGRNVNKGLLSSGTTHRAGIVANIDLAATILNYFEIGKSPSMFG